MPLFLAPTAMQRLYHHEGDKASARAAEKFGTFYSMSTMATSSIEEIANVSGGPKMFQLYIHKDQGLTDNLIDRFKSSGSKNGNTAFVYFSKISFEIIAKITTIPTAYK